MARLRSSPSAKIAVSREREAGTKAAAAAPWRKRASTRTPGDWADPPGRGTATRARGARRRRAGDPAPARRAAAPGSAGEHQHPGRLGEPAEQGDGPEGAEAYQEQQPTPV